MTRMEIMAEKKAFPSVSIIIPVYRTEAYLKECIASVLQQDYEEMEVILVDDGSPDDCPGLCDWYAERYGNIRVLHQENQGAGAARNAGINEAQGEFVLFLDSDDLLNQPNSIRKLMEIALKMQADIVTGNYRRFQGERYGPVNRHHLRNGDYAKTVDFRFRGFLIEGHLIMGGGKLYRRDFLLRNHLWYKRQIYMEDKLHNMMCCACEPVYAFVDDCVYLYRITKDSRTQQYQEKTKKLEKDWIYVAEYFYHYLKKRQQLEQFGDILAFHVFCGVFTIGRHSLQAGRMRGKKTVEILRDYGKNHLVHHTLLILSKGKYQDEIRSPVWKILMQSASILFSMKAYRLIAWGIFLLQGIGTEKKESRLQRYCKYADHNFVFK